MKRRIPSQVRLRARVVTCLLAACVPTIGGAANAADGAGADSVELSSGLMVRGTLAEGTLRVHTWLGQFEVPTDELQTVACRPPLRVTHALATRGGDVLVGKLAAKSLHFTTDDGRTVELQWSQVNRLTRPTNAAPTTKPVPTSPVVYSLNGDQVAVAAPGPVEFRTRIGALGLKPDQVCEIVLDAQSRAAHRILLSDGSSLGGFVAGDWLAVQPTQLTAPKLKVPVRALRRFDLAASAGGGAAAAAAARLDLLGGDVLRGALQGTLTLQTELGPAPIPAGDIERITPVPGFSGELTVSLRDGRTITGPPAETVAAYRLGCGATVPVPVDMIAAYARSAPGFLQLGATPDRSRGLTALLGGGDSTFAIAEQDATRCWRQPGGNYLYFAVDGRFRPWPGGVAELEVEYFDGGSGEFKVEYDSTDAAGPLNGAYKGHPEIARRADSGRWQTARFRIADARFSGAQNLRADFRIHHSGDRPLMIRAVRVRTPHLSSQSVPKGRGNGGPQIHG